MGLEKGFVKRKASTGAKVAPKVFKELQNSTLVIYGVW